MFVGVAFLFSFIDLRIRAFFFCSCGRYVIFSQFVFFFSWSFLTTTSFELPGKTGSCLSSVIAEVGCFPPSFRAV